MSNSPLSSPKAALLFAGVVVVLALVASLSVGSFLPAPAEEEEVIEEAPPELAESSPRESSPTAAWDSEGMGDDWGAPDEAEDTSDSGGTRDGDTVRDSELGDEQFGSYVPDDSGSSSSAPAATVSGPPQGDGPAITYSEAPDAPPIARPERR